MYEYSDSNSYRQLSKLAEPENFGKVIGTGFNSIIIEPSWEYWQLNVDLNSVLIFSMEREKQEFLKKCLAIKLNVLTIEKCQIKWQGII